jgi:hypothetical protein
MSRYQPGWVYLAPEQLVRTTELVERLRSYGGKLTRKELCEALGYAATNITVYNVVSRLCRGCEIATKSDPNYRRSGLQATRKQRGS